MSIWLRNIEMDILGATSHKITNSLHLGDFLFGIDATPGNTYIGGVLRPLQPLQHSHMRSAQRLYM